MDFKRKTVKVPLDGVGDVMLRQPSAMCRVNFVNYLINYEGPQNGDKPSKEFMERNTRIRLELIASSLVDETGKPIFADAKDAEENMDPDLMKPIADLIEATFPPATREQQIKNSESVQIPSLPSILPES